MKKAKQSVTNTSAQVSKASATFTIGPQGEPGAERAPQQAPEAGSETGDEPRAAAEAILQQENGLPPIYLALAISINVASDYQSNNGNAIKKKKTRSR